MTIKNNKLGYISLALAAIFLVGCGSSSSGTPKNSGTGSIDLADYFPKVDISKTFTTGEVATIDDDCILYSDTIKYQDDRKSECVEKRHNYDYYLEK